MLKFDIHEFIRESNRIEGIVRDCIDSEIIVTECFLERGVPTVEDVVDLVEVYAPNAVLRSKPGLDVQVGRHIPPRGGFHIYESLDALLKTIEDADPYEFHCEYEALHPFTDGNGRSGRVLWLWQMMMRGYTGKIGFLHQWYYQSLGGTK